MLADEGYEGSSSAGESFVFGQVAQDSFVSGCEFCRTMVCPERILAMRLGFAIPLVGSAVSSAAGLSARNGKSLDNGATHPQRCPGGCTC
jgi:hypothetical protein